MNIGGDMQSLNELDIVVFNKLHLKLLVSQDSINGSRAMHRGLWLQLYDQIGGPLENLIVRAYNNN